MCLFKVVRSGDYYLFETDSEEEEEKKQEEEKKKVEEEPPEKSAFQVTSEPVCLSVMLPVCQPACLLI